jgi:hypothetical protein
VCEREEASKVARREESDGGGGLDAAERGVGADDARDAGTTIRGAARGLDVVRAQVDAAVQVPAGGGGDVGGGHAHLRRRDPSTGRHANPQGTPCTCT